MTQGGVFTRNKRVTFIKKATSEVGDGTDFPMLVTLDQLAEIMYRVKDAWFTAGSLVIFGNNTTFQGVPNSPLVSAISVDDDSLYGTGYFYARGYSVSGTVDAAFASYFAAPYLIYSTNYRDCNTEIGIWFPDYGQLGFPLISGAGFLDVGFRCGFSHIVGCSNSDPWLYIPPDIYTAIGINDNPFISNQPANVWVNFTGEVAYIGDNPLDPTSELYLGVRMDIEGDASTNNTSYIYDTGAKFVLGLTGAETVSCKLYSYITPTSASDFVLQAQEWWPYAKDSPPTPVWDSTTGVKFQYL